jgi:hypothetical protein
MTTDAVSRSLLRLRRDQRGIAAVTVAITLPLVFAFDALAINSGLWFTIKRQNQSAADAAAISAAYEIIANPSFTCPGSTPANVSAAAGEAASQNGWTNTGTAPAVNPCYSDALVPSGVEVKLWQDQSSLFAFVPVSVPSATIATRAVATITTLNNPCLLALNPTADNAINLQDSVTVNAPGCSVVADSTKPDAIQILGSASITAKTLVTPGGISYTGNAFTVSANPLIGTAGSAVPDPFATTPTHATLVSGIPPSPAGCASPNPPPQGGATTNYAAGSRFCNGLVVSNGTTNLAPGTYWITDGDLDIQSNGHVTCSTCTDGAGVTIILTAGSATGQIGTVFMNSNSDMTLTAPPTGAFAGMLIMQDKASNIGAGVTYRSSSASFQGAASGSISGLLYLPHEQVTMQGNPNSSCSLIIADMIQLQGDSTFTLTGCPTTLTDNVTVKTVQLAE